MIQKIWTKSPRRNFLSSLARDPYRMMPGASPSLMVHSQLLVGPLMCPLEWRLSKKRLQRLDILLGLHAIDPEYGRRRVSFIYDFVPKIYYLNVFICIAKSVKIYCLSAWWQLLRTCFIKIKTIFITHPFHCFLINCI